MQKSFVAKTTINFVDFEFYVRPGDLLIHDTANQNRLTVYRNGQIVKIVKQDPLGIAAFLRNNFIEEVSTTPSPFIAPTTVTTPPLIKREKKPPVVVAPTVTPTKKIIEEFKEEPPPITDVEN